MVVTNGLYVLYCYYYCYCYYLHTYLGTAIELSLGDSSPYTFTDSCHSVAVVLTPVQTAVTRWQ
jgi:hypothetical protein